MEPVDDTGVEEAGHRQSAPFYQQAPEAPRAKRLYDGARVDALLRIGGQRDRLDAGDGVRADAFAADAQGPCSAVGKEMAAGIESSVRIDDDPRRIVSVDFADGQARVVAGDRARADDDGGRPANGAGAAGGYPPDPSRSESDPLRWQSARQGSGPPALRSDPTEAAAAGTGRESVVLRRLAGATSPIRRSEGCAPTPRARSRDRYVYRVLRSDRRPGRDRHANVSSSGGIGSWMVLKVGATEGTVADVRHVRS